MVEGFVSKGRGGFFFFQIRQPVNVSGFADLAAAGIYSSDPNLLLSCQFLQKNSKPKASEKPANNKDKFIIRRCAWF